MTAIELNPYPEINRDCIDCFNCIRLCPEDAIESEVSLGTIENQIRQRVNKYDEQPHTQIFTGNLKRTIG